ncbi:MAG: hypothetical protein RL748_2550 [Pseudomonadota bacterium]|jgi:uncharacterized protein (DUF4415 family)
MMKLPGGGPICQYAHLGEQALAVTVGSKQRQDWGGHSGDDDGKYPITAALIERQNNNGIMCQPQFNHPAPDSMQNSGPAPDANLLDKAIAIQSLEPKDIRDDGDIDFSDIPETTAQDWQGAVRGKFYRPVKQQLTIRIDADILAWLKSQGKDYQSRLNEILRDTMLKGLESK